MAMPPRAKNKNWSRPLADLVGAALDPLAAKRGFGESDILLNWDSIVGDRLAAVCEPVRLQWAIRGPKTPPDAPAEPATLHLRVEGAFALELQHLAPIICERVNARLGWRCVGRVSLKQGPLEQLAERRQPRPPPNPADVARAVEMTEGVIDDGLRDALTRLGARALSAQRSKT
jgi:hypothetical protein